MNTSTEQPSKMLTDGVCDMPAQLVMTEGRNGPAWYVDTLSEAGAKAMAESLRQKEMKAWRVVVRIELPDPRELAEQYPDGGTVELRAYLPEVCEAAP